jgi:hypothetical protein
MAAGTGTRDFTQGVGFSDLPDGLRTGKALRAPADRESLRAELDMERG